MNITNWQTKLVNLNANKNIFIAVVFCVLGIMYFFNTYTPLIADDYGAFFVYGSGERLETFWQVFESAYNYWFAWGGRVVASVFWNTSLLLGKPIFNVFNTFAYLAFVFLIYFHSLKKVKVNTALFVAINIALWIFIPAWGEGFLWLMDSCALLWVAIFILLFLLPYEEKVNHPEYRWRLLPSILMLPVGIIAGCSYENFACAVFVLLIAYVMKKLIKREKFCLFEILGLVGFFIGFALLVGAPGSYARATVMENMSQDKFNTLIESVKHYGLIGDAPTKIELTAIKYAKRFIDTVLMNLKYSSVLLVVLAFLIVKIIKRKATKQNSVAFIYIALAFFNTYVMLLAPSFPKRAYLMVNVFLLIAIFRLILNFNFSIKTLLIAFIGLIFIPLIFYPALPYRVVQNTLEIYQKLESRDKYILEQKAQGKLDITVKIPIPVVYRRKYTGFLDDIQADKTHWINMGVAQYYGINSIVGDENKEDW